MTKKPEPLPFIANRQYAQSSTAARRREQRVERVRRGEAEMPKRRWKKGHGTYAKLRKTLWSPFDEDGSVDMARLEREGFTHVDPLVDNEPAKQYPVTRRQSDTIVFADAPGFPKVINIDKVDITSWMDEQADAVMKKEGLEREIAQALPAGPVILEAIDDDDIEEPA
jgi:hypothetical protein